MGLLNIKMQQTFTKEEEVTLDPFQSEKWIYRDIDEIMKFGLANRVISRNQAEDSLERREGAGGTYSVESSEGDLREIVKLSFRSPPKPLYSVHTMQHWEGCLVINPMK